MELSNNNSWELEECISEDLLDALEEDVKTWSFTPQELSQITAKIKESKFNKKLARWIEASKPVKAAVQRKKKVNKREPVP